MDITALPPGHFTYAAALASGIPRAALRHAVRTGGIRRVRRGWYAATGPTLPVTETWVAVRADHLRRTREALADHPGCAASHSTAALVHGLPVVVSARAEVELVRIEDCPRSARLDGVTIHHTDSTETATLTVDGVRTTTVARTLADVLRSRTTPHALAVLDQTVREGRIGVDEVRDALAEQVRWRGRPRALTTLALLDPTRESWGESFSFGALAASGRVPIPQVEVFDEAFRFVGRVDGLLDVEQVVTEVHGLAKYFLPLDDAPREPEEVARTRLVAEADRRQRLERLGLAVAEWTVDEVIADRSVPSERVNRAAARQAGRPFMGWVRRDGQFCRLPLSTTQGV